MKKSNDLQRGVRWQCSLALLMVLMVFAGEAAAVATCTSRANGNWGDSGTWSCSGTPAVTQPGSANIVVLASPYTVTLNNDYPAASLTINSGATLSDTNGRVLTVTGDLVNNGTFTSATGKQGVLASTGAAAIISGNGTFGGSAYFYTSGAAPTIALGATLNFSGSAQFRIGLDPNDRTVSNSVLTINGTLNGSGLSSGSTFIRLYSSNTVVGASGVITGDNSAIEYRATGTLTNNGNVTIGTVRRNSGSGTWTNAANARLTLKTSFVTSNMTLNASAMGNTVTYVLPATPITPSSNTYYNLAGSGVACPVSYLILGASPCVSTLSVQGSPTSCTNVTGVGTVAWGSPANAYSSNNSYATASNVTRNTVTNYLSCTGFNLAVPAGATVSGITVYSERKTSGGFVRDAFVYLIKGGSISTSLNAALASNYPTTDEIKTHGGQTNLWGTTWTVAELNAANFGVAFSSKNTSTTSATNRTVSVDHIQVRVDYTITGFHHIRIEHDGAASSCAPEPITLKACANASCSSLYTSGDVTGIGLSPTSGGSTWTPGNTVAIAAASGGINSGIQLARSAGTATLAITGTSSPAPGNAYECYNTATGTSGSCSLVFSDGILSFNVPDHTAATRQLVTITSCSSAFKNVTRSIKFWSSYVNPATGTQQGKVAAGTGNADCATGYANLGVASGSATTLNLAFGAGNSPQATFSLCYPDVGAVKLDAQYNGSSATGDNGVTITGSDSFIAKPNHFAVSNIKRTSDNIANPVDAGDATKPAFIKAGDSSFAATQFTATITARNALGAITPNFGLESAPGPAGVSLTAVLVAPSGGDVGLLTCKGSNTGCVVPGGSANFSGGATTVSDLAWNEVGVIKLLPTAANGDYLGAGEVATPTASVNVGRFYPHRFGVTPDPTASIENRSDWCDGGFLVSDGVTPCVTPDFTYMGEQMNAQFVLTALAAGGETTRNYTTSAVAAQNFARLDPTASGNPLGFAAVNATGPTYLSARLDTALNASGIFDVGQANISAPLFFTRPLTPDGPYAALRIGVLPVDSDGVTLTGLDLDTDATAGNDHALIGTTEVRYGRIWIPNAYGSELLPLPIRTTVQYHNGTNWVPSATDNETWFDSTLFHITLSPTGNLVASVVSGLGSGLAVVSPGAAGVTAGVRTIRLAAPGVRGSANISLNSPSYLPSTVGRVTFGVYRSPLIYRRENY